MERWKNIPADLFVEVGNDGGGWRLSGGTRFDGRAVPVNLSKWLQDRCNDSDGRLNSGELAVAIESTGYYDPGVYGGPMDGSYPAEGNDERTVVGAVIDDAKLPIELLDEISQWLAEDIAAVVIESPEPDYD